MICEYLEEKYPQNPLTPSDLVERARMRAWMHYIEEVAVGAIRVPSFNRAFLYRFDGLDQQRFEDEQMNVRKVRKELFQRMGSPKGFSKAEVDRSLGELSETCRRMNEAIAEKGPVAPRRAVHACGCAGDAEHRSHGRSWPLAFMGGQVSACFGLVRAPEGKAIVPGDVLSWLACFRLPRIPAALRDGPRVTIDLSASI